MLGKRRILAEDTCSGAGGGVGGEVGGEGGTL